jgi:hypothetical protein
VNLLIYLADQLLRGCQSGDNQFQALQNQGTEGFSVHGSRLLELEAEVAQIQPFVLISIRYLLSVDQQDLVLAGFLFLSFGPLADSSLFSYCFGFYSVFVCGFYILCLPLSCCDLKGEYFLAMVFILGFTLCPAKTMRGSNCFVIFLITLFYPLSFCDKKGE